MTPASDEPSAPEQRRTGLDDPRALDILTTEHWSLLSARTLGYQEMFGRTTIFIGILSGTIIALALLAQVTRFGHETLTFAAVLFAVSLFIGLVSFVRCVAINLEDARWVVGMSLLRRAYLQIVPGAGAVLRGESSARCRIANARIRLAADLRQSRQEPDDDVILRGRAQLRACRYAHERLGCARRPCPHANPRHRRLRLPRIGSPSCPVRVSLSAATCARNDVAEQCRLTTRSTRTPRRRRLRAVRSRPVNLVRYAAQALHLIASQK